MNSFSNILTETGTLPDLIIEDVNDTYLCHYSRCVSDNNINPETKNIWRICLIRKTEGRTRTLYPNGSRLFRFCPNNINEYSFEYAKN